MHLYEQKNFIIVLGLINKEYYYYCQLYSHSESLCNVPQFTTQSIIDFIILFLYYNNKLTGCRPDQYTNKNTNKHNHTL